MGKKFTLTNEDKIFALKFGHENVRSKKSRDVDNASSRNVSMDFAKNWRDASRNDFEGIDTIVKKEIPGYTEQKGKKAFRKMSNIFGESGFV